VSKKPGKTPGAAPLSSGFGFVEFASAKAAQAAMAKLQGVALDGHALKLAVSRAAPGRAATSRGGGGDADAGGDRKGKKGSGLSDTKIIVRNVAFEATKKDLKTLFAPFGQLKSLRQPRKFDGQHRGFAFVEMTTKAEAKAAYEALSQTHLYGRHLVLEWAKEGEGIEELRAKTAAQYAAGEAAALSGAGGGSSSGKRKQRGDVADAEDDY
jgi:multiple RNA-binding domain-containing protein 1